MLSEKEVKDLRTKMKENYVYFSTFARQLNVSRQMVYMVVNGKAKSERIEDHLRRWLTLGK